MGLRDWFRRSPRAYLTVADVAKGPSGAAMFPAEEYDGDARFWRSPDYADVMRAVPDLMAQVDEAAEADIAELHAEWARQDELAQAHYEALAEDHWRDAHAGQAPDGELAVDRHDGHDAVEVEAGERFGYVRDIREAEWDAHYDEALRTMPPAPAEWKDGPYGDWTREQGGTVRYHPNHPGYVESDDYLEDRYYGWQEQQEAEGEGARLQDQFDVVEDIGGAHEWQHISDSFDRYDGPLTWAQYSAAAQVPGGLAAAEAEAWAREDTARWDTHENDIASADSHDERLEDEHVRDTDHDLALLEADFRANHGGKAPDADETAAFEAAWEADNADEDRGMHANDRSTCYRDEGWAHDHAHDPITGIRIEDTTDQPLDAQWADAARYSGATGAFVDHTTHFGPVSADAELEASWYAPTVAEPSRHHDDSDGS